MLQPAGLCYAAVTFFPILLLFNDRLEQRDLGNYKTDLHKIFRDGRHVGVDVKSGIGFRIGQGTLPWQPLLDSHSPTDGSMERRMGALTAQTSCLHRSKIW